MCEYLERMSIKGTATEDIRLWSGYAHRVVELTGPFPTTDDVSVYLWLHEDSASLLLDMCDEIDSRFDALQEENKRLWEQVMQLKVDWEGERDYADLMEAKEIQAVAENEKLRKKINALKAHGIEIVDAVAGGYEIYDTSQREVDRLEVENEKLLNLAKQIRKTLSEAEGETDTCGHCDLFSECASRGWKECEFDRRIELFGSRAHKAETQEP